MSGRIVRYRRDAMVQTRAGARAEAARLMAYAAEHGTLDEPERSPTFRTFVEGQFSRLYLPKYRPATRVRYVALLRQGLMDVFGAMRLDDIDDLRIRAYSATLAERGVQQKGPVTFLRTILRSAVEVGALHTLPTFPKLATSKKLPSSPSAEEINAMLDRARGWLRIAIALATYAGLRSGEVRGLQVGDVDLAKGCVHIKRALSEDEETTPKSGHDRIVPLHPDLRGVLVEATRGKFPRAPIVVTSSGSTPTRQKILSHLKALQDRLGLPHRSFHQLRHFFASEVVGRASIEVVRQWLGHANLATTQRYVHADASRFRQAIDASFGQLRGNG